MTSAAPEVLRLYLIRHGETAWSLSGQHTGLADIPLTARGEAEALELGQALRSTPFAYAFTSPRQRARRTSELVSPGPSVRVEPDLAEWDYGDYEGLKTSEILARRADWNLFRDGCPSGELPAQVLARIERFLARIRALHGNVALFSHGHLSCALAACWIGLPLIEAEHFQLGTAAVAVLSYATHHPKTPVIAQWNVQPARLPVQGPSDLEETG